MVKCNFQMISEGKFMPNNIKRQLFNFKSFFPQIKNYNGVCSLQILPWTENKVVVILAEIADNPGTPITNAFEKVATQVYHKFLSEISISDIIWIEHYNKNSYHNKDYNEETFDQVILSWNDRTQQFCNPR